MIQITQRTAEVDDPLPACLARQKGRDYSILVQGQQRSEQVPVDNVIYRTEYASTGQL